MFFFFLTANETRGSPFTQAVLALIAGLLPERHSDDISVLKLKVVWSVGAEIRILMLAKQRFPKACAAHTADTTLLFSSAHKRILFCNSTSRILVFPSVLEILTRVNACKAFISDAVKLYWHTVKSQRYHPQILQSAILLFLMDSIF